MKSKGQLLARLEQNADEVSTALTQTTDEAFTGKSFAVPQPSSPASGMPSTARMA
jgi:hypothetical protein